MAVKIKLKRLGKIREPYYRIVVADARTKRDGRAIEEIGVYQPKLDPSVIEVNSERAQYWLSVGAQPTDPVRHLLEITGDWQKFKGLPGTEGTLKTAEPKADKKERYDALVKESLATKEAKESAKGGSKSSRGSQSKKDAPKDAPKDTAKDAPKGASKDAPKDAPKDAVKDSPKKDADAAAEPAASAEAVAPAEAAADGASES